MDPSTDSEQQKHDADVAEPISAGEPTEHQARESLNRNNWNKNAAYDEFDGTPEPSATQNDEAAGGNKDAAESESSTGHLAGHTSGRTLDGRASDGPPVLNAGGSSSRSNAGKVVTMDDLKKGEDGGENLFAGGEKSGLAVKGPEDARNRDRAKVEDILNNARRNTEAKGASAGASLSRPTHFYGAGRILGGDSFDSVTVPATQETPTPRVSDRQIPNRQVRHTLHVWQDGVSINEGPLFKYGENATPGYLEELGKGQIPEDISKLIDIKPGQEAEIDVQTHKEVWRQLPYVYRPFIDGGNRLGSPVPGISSSSTDATVATGTTPRQAEVDESQPIVTIRIQLPNGARLPARFNTTQTIGDVYEFVQQSSPDTRDGNWVLATTFPNKEHIDRSAVLGEMDEFKRGGLAIVKWKSVGDF